MAECYTYIKIQHETIIFQGVSFLYAYKMVKKKTYCDIHACIVLASWYTTNSHQGPFLASALWRQFINTYNYIKKTWQCTGQNRSHASICIPIPYSAVQVLIKYMWFNFLFLNIYKFQENTWKQNCMYSKLWKHAPAIVKDPAVIA